MEATKNITEMTKEEREVIENQRAEWLKKVTNGFMMERRTNNPIDLELRFNHEYLALGPFLIHSQLGLKFELSYDEKRKKVHLAFIGVPEDERRKGHGTEMMKLLIEIAKKHSYKEVNLEICPKFGTNKRTLNKFYKNFGFEPSHSSSKDKRVLTF